MTHTITIETQSENDFAQIKKFVENLGLPYKEDHAESQSDRERLRVLEGICWEGEETGNELNAMIQGARYFGPRDVEL